MQSQKPAYSKKRYASTKIDKGKRKQTCFKCWEEGHYVNKCPIKGKINELDIDQERKDEPLQLVLTNSEQSSKGEILELQEESDSYSSTEYELKQEGRRTCERTFFILHPVQRSVSKVKVHLTGYLY